MWWAPADHAKAAMRRRSSQTQHPPDKSYLVFGLDSWGALKEFDVNIIVPLAGKP